MGRSVLVAMALCATVALTTSCDPCFATSSCGASGASRLDIQGQLVRAATGRGVDGVRVDVMRRSGVSLAADSFSVVTSGGGFWHVESPAQSSGSVVLDFRVHTPALPHPYMLTGRNVATVDRAGDATLIERWVVDPYSNYSVSLHLRPTNKIVTSTAVALQRRSDTWLTGPDLTDSTGKSQTDGTGLAKLFNGFGYFTDTGDVVGDLTVPLGAPYGTSVVRGLVLHPSYVYHATPTIITAGVGPSLAYAVEVFDRATGQPVAGIPFRATRVSGVSVATNTVTGVSDAYGYVRPGFAAAGVGTLDATLTLTPHVGSAVTIPLTMPTFDDDNGRLLASVSVGAALNYAVQVFDRATGRPAPGVAFTATRVSGISVQPTTISGVTDADGYARTSFVPQSTGSLVASFTFTPRVGTPVTTQFTMPTFETDAGRLLANISVGSYLNYYGIVDAGPATPLANVPVRVRSTGGVAVAPLDTTVTTNASGAFPLDPVPQAVGDAILELTVTPPAPYRAFIVKNVVIGTMQQDFPFGQRVWVWDVTGPLNGPSGSTASYLP